MAEATYPSAEEPQMRGQSFNQKFGDFKKFASTSFTRAKQYTVEKLGRADSITEFDSEYESLSTQLDQIKHTTEQMLGHVRTLVQPNPGLRFEDKLYTRFDKQQPHRTTAHELLSVELARAGNEFGTETQYGTYLLRCAEVEQKLGESQRRFQEKAQAEFITPLKAFLEIDVKAVMRDKRLLKVKRLDLDAHRAKAKKAQEGERLQAAEAEVRTSQADYEMQLEKVRSSLKKIVQTHTNHQGHLRTLMAAQRAHFAECLAHLGELDKEGSPSGGGVASEPVKEPQTGRFIVNGIELDREESRKARVLYDYDADNESELTVFTDQVITVTPISDDDDYMMAEHEGKSGKVPSTYVELL